MKTSIGQQLLKKSLSHKLLFSSQIKGFARNLKSAQVKKQEEKKQVQQEDQIEKVKKEENTSLNTQKQKVIREQLYDIDRFLSANLLIQYSNEQGKDLANPSMVTVLEKINTISKNESYQNQIYQSEDFQQFLDLVKTRYFQENLSDTLRIQILQNLLQLRCKDDQILKFTCLLVTSGKIQNIQSITNILYTLVKFYHKPLSISQPNNTKHIIDQNFIDKCIQLLKAEPVLPLTIVCRNLWNFYGLNMFDKDLFDKFSGIIAKHSDKLNELDVSNAFRSYAHFKYLNGPALEGLIKNTIQNADQFKFQTLAVITNSLADLDIKNNTVFQIIKNILVKEELENGQLVLSNKLQPVDCAQLMTAYCKVGLYDIDLFYGLELSFVNLIEYTYGQNIVTMFVAHSKWAEYLVNQCLVEKKQQRRVYNYFKSYNEEFQEKLITNLIRCSHEINLKGVMLVLAQGNLPHLKKRSNTRLMHQFSLKGIQTLKDEKESIKSKDLFDQMCTKYFELCNPYCLNKEDKQNLVNEFKSILDIDILDLYEHISPLGLSSPLIQTEDPQLKEKKEKKKKAKKQFKEERDEDLKDEEEYIDEVKSENAHLEK